MRKIQTGKVRKTAAKCLHVWPMVHIITLMYTTTLLYRGKYIYMTVPISFYQYGDIIIEMNAHVECNG